MNKKGISSAVLIVLLVLGVLAYTQGYLDFILKPTPTPTPPPIGQCPSSGLTEVTVSTQKALASTATNAQHDYFVFDNGVLVANGNSGSDGQSIFDVKCGVGKTYSAIVINDSTGAQDADTGFYAETFSIDASESTFIKNLQTYGYGTVDISNIGSSADPAGNSNVSSGLGKSCGFTITFTENKTASAFNKPLILCETNSTSVDKVSMTGATEVSLSKRPSRLSALEPTDSQWHIFEVDELFKSTDAAIKVSGKIDFADCSSCTPATDNNMTCRVIDQATYKVPDYQTLSLNEGFVMGVEDDSNADVGGYDSDMVTLWFNHVASGYC